MERSRLRRLGALLVSAAMLASLTVTTVVTPVAAAKAACQGRIATIVGTNGHDVLTGTNGPDVIAGLGGNDRIIGRGGNDVLCGGAGRDVLVGVAGRDRLYGNGGPDRLIGGPAADYLFGGVGDDVLSGRTGDDRLNGGPGDDTCYQDTGSGPLAACELPVPIPPPPPPPPPLVIGGPGSGQIAGAFWANFSGTAGPWSISVGSCTAGRLNYGASGSEEYRFALEFPLANLPAGATILSAKLSMSAAGASPPQNLYGYTGNGSISTGDATPAGSSIVHQAPAAGYQAVDVSSLVTPAMVTAGWAGFLQTREDWDTGQWACRTSDAEYPKLTVEYRNP